MCGQHVLDTGDFTKAHREFIRFFIRAKDMDVRPGIHRVTSGRARFAPFPDGLHHSH